MPSHTFMLLQGQMVQMEVHPDAINTVAVSLEDGTNIYAVAGEAEEKKLITLQQIIEEDKQKNLLMQIWDESAAAWFPFKCRKASNKSTKY